MKITATSVLLLLSGLASTQSTDRPDIALHTVTYEGTGCPSTSKVISSIEALSVHNISQLKHTYKTTASYGPEVQHTDSFRNCKISTVLSYPANEWDFSITYWNKTISIVDLENPKITAVNNEYLWFNDERYQPDGFIFGVKTYSGPVAARDAKSTHFPSNEKTQVVPKVECNGIAGARKKVALHLDSAVNIQGSNGQTPRTGNPGAPKGTFGGEVAYSVQLVWSRHNRCQ